MDLRCPASRNHASTIRLFRSGVFTASASFGLIEFTVDRVNVVETGARINADARHIAKPFILDGFTHRVVIDDLLVDVFQRCAVTAIGRGGKSVKSLRESSARKPPASKMRLYEADVL